MAKKILLLEASATVANAIAIALQHNGYRMRWEPNGSNVGHILKEQSYDLIITSYVFNRTTGAQIANDVWVAQPLLPVIIFTSEPQRKDVQKAPCNAIVGKPYTAELIDTVIQLLS